MGVVVEGFFTLTLALSLRERGVGRGDCNGSLILR